MSDKVESTRLTSSTTSTSIPDLVVSSTIAVTGSLPFNMDLLDVVSSSIAVTGSLPFHMDLLDIVSTVAILATIFLFLCGIPICQTIASKGNTDNVPAAPFLLGTVGGAFWLRYGIFKSDSTVITINVIGFVLEFAYLLFYWYHTRNRTNLNRQIFSLLLVTAGMLYYVNANGASDPEGTIANLGMLCVVFNVLNFAAPLSGLADVVRIKSSENLPLPLCVAGLMVSGLWFTYGILVNDNYIKFPNVIGIGLSLVQISLFFIYPPRRAHHS